MTRIIGVMQGSGYVTSTLLGRPFNLRREHREAIEAWPDLSLIAVGDKTMTRLVV
jgi:uncharacterized protein YlzI (FlbEa/FlbD family)